MDEALSASPHENRDPRGEPDEDARRDGERDVELRLRGDPTWLRIGLAGVTVASIALFALYILSLKNPNVPVALAVLPGLAVATFAGSALAFWGRRRGGPARLVSGRGMLTLREPSAREHLIDRARPFAAVVVQDTRSPRRVLLVAQSDAPVTVLDAAGVGAIPAAWESRVVRVDLTPVPLSPATAHVHTLAAGESLAPLLESLATDLAPEAALASFATPSGEVLLVHRDEIRLGRRVFPSRGTTVQRRNLAGAQSELPAVALRAGDHSALLAAQDVTELSDGTVASETPDAFLPPVLFALVASRFD